ncbi:MAG: protein kinase [Methylacidiphilales bacterium]|nr:protein kinase [Candidatus Methylacidiphilales bacterium]
MASELTPVPDDLDFGVTIRGLVVSQQVFGRYSLRHVLGRGGMGVVWLAHDERLERDVALKFLPEAVHFDAGALDDLKRETRRCLDLTHPNIIRIYDFVTDQQAAAISMEYIDGKTLAALRIDKENRVFEVGELSDWMAQACQALFYAHEEVKVVHRDLKPANLMLTSRGQVKIADFGIARSVSDSMTAVTMRKATSGTLVYMSPQQMNGDMSRVTDDIYALGATIYEFLTSKPPFYSGDIPFQVRQSIPKRMSERRQELEITGQEIPKEWEETVAACLEKVPEQRPKDMLEVAERLGLPIGTRQTRSSTETAKKTTVTAKDSKTTARPPGMPPPPPAQKPPRKPFPTKKVLLAGAGVVALGLLGWGLWSFVLWPFIATKGELFVTSDPSGATVHIWGQKDQVTPADFQALWLGRYHVTVSETGYDPDEETVTIAEGQTVKLPAITLKRTFGKLNLTSSPTDAHYSLDGTNVTSDTSKEGTTPDFLENLPAGDYQLTLSKSGVTSHTETVEVPGHNTLTENIDLIKLGIAAGASPDTAKVILGQMDAGQLDAKGKSELVDLLGQAFEKYLSYGVLAPAAADLAQLKALGQDTTKQDKELSDTRASTEKDIASQIKDLISDKKFAAAQLQLDQLNGVLEKESIDRLDAQFQPQLSQYQQQVDAAIKMSQTGPPADGYKQLKTFAAQYPDDMKLVLALAQLETEMPPDHDKLTAQIKVFKQFAADNKGAGGNADFQAMQDKFANELKQLDDLANALDEAKNGSSSVRDQINTLEAEKAAAEKEPVGAQNVQAATDTLNFFGKVITGHSVVNNPFFGSQQDKDQRIADLQAKIDADQQTLSQPQGNVDAAQKQYDAFVAKVPW